MSSFRILAAFDVLILECCW